MVMDAMAGAEDTIYLCNFRVSVDGDWLCLKELAEGVSSQGAATTQGGSGSVSPASPPSGFQGRMHSSSVITSPLGDEGGAVGGLASLLPPSLFAPYAPICYERDPVSIERSNLVNICKLVVKELIESSLKYGRMLDSDSVPLQHFFIVFEHVLRHGLKPKRGILGPKKELWDLFQMVEKWTYEAQDITSSVRDLPTVSTHIGRARAWLRLALMQKKLPDYFRLLLEHRDDLLTAFYEPGSLMLSDEAIVIMGLLVGLNVIDCNLCVKEEELDSQMGVIDFSLYLRTSPCEIYGSNSIKAESSDMTTVLDQKNYIEELNRHLNATVTNLQAKTESLVTTNALMKEDLSIAKSTIMQLQEENDRLRRQNGIPTQQQLDKADREAKRAARISVIGCEEELQDLKRHLEEESCHRKQVERELELQIQMKAESEMAAKLLEKDIHEKQDTIVSLREQLDEIKTINLEMYIKLQECEEELSEKGLIVARLQEKTQNISKMLINLQNGAFFNNQQQGGDRPSRSSWAQDSCSSANYSVRKEEGSNATDGMHLLRRESTPVSPNKIDKPKIGTSQSMDSISPSKVMDIQDECESSLKSKTEQVGRLEILLTDLKDSVHLLEIQLEDGKAANASMFSETQTAYDDTDEVCSRTNDLKIERIWHQSLQESSDREKALSENLYKKTKELTQLKKELESLKVAHTHLITTVEEQERTMEELGIHLSESKLRVAEINDASKSFRDAQWAPDKQATHCSLCKKDFNIARRRHHCRHCGNIFCHTCSDNNMPLPSSARPVRVCDLCHTQLLDRYSQ